MSAGFRAIELEGRIDGEHRLQLDARLPEASPGPVRVLVQIPDEELDENRWLDAAAIPAFDFLSDPAEHGYSLANGKPFHDQG